MRKTIFICIVVVPRGDTSPKHQGDVVRIVNTSGATMVTYTYDAWGKVTIITQNTVHGRNIANANPLRYRGYYYDSELEMYYLQSRYYDPAIGRFINADSYASTGQGFLGYNMFAYCGNNPVNGCDPCGSCFHRWDFWNDCDQCGGKTLQNKIDDYIVLVDKYHTMMIEDQRYQTQLQIQLVEGTIRGFVDAHTRAEMEIAKAQREQDLATVVFFSNPEVWIGLFYATSEICEVTSLYCGLASAKIPIPTFGLKVEKIMAITAIVGYIAEKLAETIEKLTGEV